MTVELPFTITVYDRAFTRVGWVGSPIGVQVYPRHNMLPTARLVVSADDRVAADLVAPGARVTINLGGVHLVGGPVRTARGGGPGPGGDIELDVHDDWRLLQRVLGWPVPTVSGTTVSGPIVGQDTAEYDVKDGPAETVAKWFITRAVTRLGLPVIVAADQGRGAHVELKMRMHPLADRLLPAIDQAGIGVTVRQQGDHLLVDVYEPQTSAFLITEASGIVAEWRWTQNAPAATRVVVGGAGEGTARAFRQSIDTPREVAWGDVIEVFRDARDVGGDVNPATTMDRRALEVLGEGAPSHGLRLTLTETGAWRYGHAFTVGDRVTHEIGPGVPVTDVLREARISYDRDEGLTITSIVGDRTEPDTLVARAIAALTRATRNLTAGR